MENFPGNSHNPTGPKAKPAKAEKVVEKVVTGEVIQKPKSLGRRFKDLFMRGESKGAVDYVVGDVMLPAFRNLIVDATSKGVERLIYGDTAPRRGRSPLEYRQPRVQYNTPVDRSYRGGPPGILPGQPPLRQPAHRRPDAGEVILLNKEDAELVLERLTDIIDTYDFATVADLKELVGLPAAYVDANWGWTSLQYADIRQTREGYLLDLPQAEPNR